MRRMKIKNWILAFINEYKTFVWNHVFYEPAKIKKEMKKTVNNYGAHAAPKFLSTVQYSELSPTWRSCRLHPSKHAVLQCPASSKLGKCSLQLQRLQVVLSMQANIILCAVLFFLEQILLCQAKRRSSPMI